MKDILANRIKGYSCLMVLFGHVILGVRTAGIHAPSFMIGLETLLYSFHIFLFMFISGYVYTLAGGWEKKGSRAKFLLNKLLNLGVPYLVFSVLYIVINAVTPGVNASGSFSDILMIWRTPVAQFWFLYALFLIFVFWVLLSSFLNRYLTILILYGVYVAAKLLGFDLDFLAAPLGCVLYFGFGACCSSLKFEKIPIYCKVLYILLHIGIFSVLYSFEWDQIFPIDDILAILGILASIFLIDLICRWNPIGKALDFVCKYSFQIYLLHTFFTSAVRILLNKIGVSGYVVQVVLGSIVGFLLPIAIAWIASKSPWLDFFFHPARSIEIIRNHKKKKRVS